MTIFISDKYKLYPKGKQLGGGAHGIVYLSTTSDNKVYAIKKISPSNGVNFTALREIKSLKELQHENILGLHDVFIHKKCIYLVYERMHYELSHVIKGQDFLKRGDIACYMKQLLQALAYCHANFILHRDVKPSNLLLSPNQPMKLADFGLAKNFGEENERFTPGCVTRWYRAPELLFGASLYGPAVDIWSCGCIFAELMLRVPLFPGDNDLDQLGKIFALLGTVNEQNWPNVSTLPSYQEFEDRPPTPLREVFVGASDEAIDLLSKMLQLNPNNRISAIDALNHPFFKGELTPIESLPIPEGIKDY